MGSAVMPCLLRDLHGEPEHWFGSVRAIKAHSPVSPEDRGQIGKMADAWLRWGTEHGYRW